MCAQVSVVFMALGGSGLAVFWRGRPTTDDAPSEIETEVIPVPSAASN